jgi:flagellar biosynthetic protein FlhB
MAEGTAGDRTEKATPRRREKARERGQVARSLEVNSALLLAVGLTLLIALGGHFTRVLGENSRYLFGQAHVIRSDNPAAISTLLVGNLLALAKALAPLVGALLLAGIAANVAQVGLHVTPHALVPKPEKLNPITGLKRFFEARAFFDLAKHLVKIILIGWIAYLTLAGLMARLGATPLLPIPAIVAVGKRGFAELMARLLIVMFMLALIDWIWQRYQHEKNLKMSKYEVRQELKDIEGDPQIKARIRGLQLEMARKRMLADVPRADVVITNPTHYAVALRYERGAAAPVVLAKGRDALAEIIKKIARRARVPVIENKPVAQALYRQVEVGQMIPESLYQTVAEILAYIYRLRKS